MGMKQDTNDGKGAKAMKIECEFCNGDGYVKTNTGEFEGDCCPNGCTEIIVESLKKAKEILSAKESPK